MLLLNHPFTSTIFPSTITNTLSSFLGRIFARLVKPYVDSVDLAIGNLELTLAGPPYTGYPQFGSPDALGATLKDMGFDVLVTANNHCVDRGRKGLEPTIMMLDSFEIAHTGTFVDSLARVNESPLIIEKMGLNLLSLITPTVRMDFR